MDKELDMFDWLFNYPTLPVSVLAGFGFAAITLLGILVLAPFTREWLHRDHSSNEIIGITLDGFTALYGILLGLLAVGAYEKINDMDDIVSKEASSISVLYRDFRGYPQPLRQNLEDGLRGYATEVVEKSWPQQARQLMPTGESQYIDAVFDLLISFKPGDKGEEIIHATTLNRFNELLDNRRSRLTNLNSRIPSILWWLVGLGAAINLILICLLDFERRIHILFGGTLSFFVGVMIFVIAAMDNPFSGADRIGPDAIRQVLNSPSMSKK